MKLGGKSKLSSGMECSCLRAVAKETVMESTVCTIALQKNKHTTTWAKQQSATDLRTVAISKWTLRR